MAVVTYRLDTRIHFIARERKHILSSLQECKWILLPQIDSVVQIARPEQSASSSVWCSIYTQVTMKVGHWIGLE
jgi:hypothetical protein